MCVEQLTFSVSHTLEKARKGPVWLHPERSVARLLGEGAAAPLGARETRCTFGPVGGGAP